MLVIAPYCINFFGNCFFGNCIFAMQTRTLSEVYKSAINQ